MSGITEREKGLLLGAAVVVVVSLYFVARVQPLRTELKSLREEVASLEQRVRNTPMPKPPADPEAAKKQLEEAKTRLARTREEFDVLMQERADRDSNQALGGLMLEILTLAKAKGVSVDTSSVYAGSIADLGVVSKEEIARLQSGSEPLPFRPLRSLSLRGDYPHIRGFVEELPRLGHAVSVLRFSLKAEGDKAGVRPSGLRAELVLAL